MVIGEDIKKKISDTPDGVVLTIGDFNVDMQYQGALVKALNRLVDQGTLQRLSKGKYYKPRKTIFGTLKPVPEEITKDFLEKNGKLVGYITGNRAFALMGLTTQITSSLLIGTNRYRHPLTRGDYAISFLQQHNPNAYNKKSISGYYYLFTSSLELHYWMCFSSPQELQKPKMIKKYCYYLMVPNIMATFAATTSDVNICDCPKQG